MYARIPDKGIRLISYAVWWIRAYIQNYILKSWSLVKLGTTQAQRKLFFSLARTRRELDKSSVEHGADSDGRDSSKVASKLRVKASEVDEMAQRMEGRDLSLDAPLGDDGGTSHVDFVAGSDPGADDELSGAQEQAMVSGRVGAALARLDRRERFIIEQRVMSEQPMTLKELGEHFGFSRERARQLEIRAKEKLKTELHALAVDLDWPTDGSPVDLDDAQRPSRIPAPVRLRLRPPRRVDGRGRRLRAHPVHDRGGDPDRGRHARDEERAVDRALVDRELRDEHDRAHRHLREERRDGEQRDEERPPCHRARANHHRAGEEPEDRALVAGAEQPAVEEHGRGLARRRGLAVARADGDGRLPDDELDHREGARDADGRDLAGGAERD